MTTQGHNARQVKLERSLESERGDSGLLLLPLSSCVNFDLSLHEFSPLESRDAMVRGL